jgi:hypothetical protein
VMKSTPTPVWGVSKLPFAIANGAGHTDCADATWGWNTGSAGDETVPTARIATKPPNANKTARLRRQAAIDLIPFERLERSPPRSNTAGPFPYEHSRPVENRKYDVPTPIPCFTSTRRERPHIAPHRMVSRPARHFLLLCNGKIPQQATATYISST